MIKVLQLLLHLPLLQVRLPGNVIYFIKYFKSLNSFEVIPVKKIFQSFSSDMALNNLPINNLALLGY